MNLPFTSETVNGESFVAFMTMVWDDAGPLYDQWQDANKTARAAGAVRVGIRGDGYERYVTWRFSNGDEIDVVQNKDRTGTGITDVRVKLTTEQHINRANALSVLIDACDQRPELLLREFNFVVDWLKKHRAAGERDLDELVKFPENW